VRKRAGYGHAKLVSSCPFALDGKGFSDVMLDRWLMHRMFSAQTALGSFHCVSYVILGHSILESTQLEKVCHSVSVSLQVPP